MTPHAVLLRAIAHEMSSQKMLYVFTTQVEYEIRDELVRSFYTEQSELFHSMKEAFVRKSEPIFQLKEVHVHSIENISNECLLSFFGRGNLNFVLTIFRLIGRSVTSSALMRVGTEHRSLGNVDS